MSSDKKFKVLISGGYGNGNAGDEALMIVLLKQLRSTYDNCEITIFSDDVEYSKTRYDEKFVYSGGRGLLEPNKRGINSISWFFKNIKEIYNCNILITGGGTILQDTTNFMFVPFWLSKILLAKLFYKKTVMYGIGVGPMKTKFAKFLTYLIVNRMDLITLRGPLSFDELKRIKIDKPPIHVLSDPALVLEKANTQRVKELLNNECVNTISNIIGFSVRHWFINHKKSLHGEPVWDEVNKCRYNNLITCFALLADYLVDKYNNNILFIPMSIKESKDDRQAAEDIVKLMQNKSSAYIIRGDYTPQETKGIIGQCTILVAMRLHSAIFAVPQKIPVLPVGYGDKMKDFMSTVELDNLVINVNNIDIIQLKKIADQIIADPKSATATDFNIEKIIKNAKHNIHNIKELTSL